MAQLIIGTRGSALALKQTHDVADSLRRAHPDLDLDIRTIQTRGDATQASNIPLSSFGEKGIFAKELETALLAGEIDLAVHSMKDMAHTLPEGLLIAAVPQREDPRDALIGSALDALPSGARVGTGSVRRRALLLSRRPDLHLLEIRGNIDTRLRKLRQGQYDAICLAVAGLNRLGLQADIAEILDPHWFTPDPGQGALALECRNDNVVAREMMAVLNHQTSWYETQAERGFLQAVGGSCHTPVGAMAQVAGEDVSIVGMLASSDGVTILREKAHAPRDGINTLGRKLADKLRAAGADQLLMEGMVGRLTP